MVLGEELGVKSHRLDFEEALGDKEKEIKEKNLRKIERTERQASWSGLRRQRMLAASESGHAPAIAEAPGLGSGGELGKGGGGILEGWRMGLEKV